MRSNCHLEAWRRYRNGEARALVFIPTRYSVAVKVFNHPVLFPLRILGIAIQWIAWPLTHIGEFLRSGKWYHVQWIDKDDIWWEYVKISNDEFDPIPTFIPPLIFKGRVRKVETS